MHQVLLVDSNYKDLEQIEYYLRGIRLKIVSTSNVKKIMEFARSAPPDLMIIGLEPTDSEMLDKIKLLRFDSITRNALILAIYKTEDKKQLNKFHTENVHAVMIHPVFKIELREMVDKLLSTAQEKRTKHEQETKEYIMIDRSQEGQTHIILEGGLRRNVGPQLRTFFTKDFIDEAKKTIVCLDLRLIHDLLAAELEIIEKIALVFGSKRINVVAGKHLGLILSDTELGEKVNLFMSMEEYEHIRKSNLLE